jgi:thioredoxin reductase (NADPH)
MSETDEPRVAIVGGGVAGLTAGTFTAREGFDTVVVNHGESILRRNSHLENVPGFPAGVNSRLFLDLLEEQAGRSGCLFEQGLVTNLQSTEEGFQLRVEADDEFDLVADYVVVASWSDTGYLEAIEEIGLTKRGSKTYIDIDDDGRTDVDGLYAAGRIAGKEHQTVICAGHGADVALTLVHDSEVPFYHDWVAPEGYFTERDREVPPGVEEIDEAERRRRERESMEIMTEAFEDYHPEEPTMHPSVVEKRENDAEGDDD